MAESTTKLEAELAADRARLQETLRALEARIAPGNLAKEAMHYLEVGPGDFAARLGKQLYANPLPSLLTGIGLAWLIGAGSSPARPYAGDRDYETSAEDLRASELLNILEEEEARTLRRDDEPFDAFEDRRISAQAVIVGVNRDEGEERESFRRRVGHAVEKLRENARAARERIGAAASKAGHGIGAAAGTIASAFSGAGHGIGAAAKASGAGASAAYRGVKEAPKRAIHFGEDHPLAAGAVGFALGAVIGSVTPLSRVEHDALKKLADAGLARGASAADKAASYVAEAARDVADRNAPKGF